MDLQPGRMVELDGSLFLVEEVRLDVTLQAIEPLKERLEIAFNHNETVTHNPVFRRLQGDLLDPQFRSPRLKVLFPEGEGE